MPSSIAAVGFGLTTYPIGVERGYITREQARQRVLTTLRFFAEAKQGPDPRGVTGHRGFFYHSNEGKAVVGIVEVIRPYYPDHTDESARFGMVDVRAVEALPRPVTLDAIKAEAGLKDMVLVNNSRLSVQPVSEAEWTLIRRMGGLA